jgi:hypothetical protein
MCGSHDVRANWKDSRIAVVSCAACRRVVRIEFDPPDAPGVRARIEPLYDPDEDVTLED